VAVAVRTDLPQSLLWCTLYCSEAAGAKGRQRAAAHLAAFLRGQLDSPLLEGQVQQGGQCGAAAGEQQGGEGVKREAWEEVGEQGAQEGAGALDAYLLPPAMHRHWEPLLTFVTVPELPRG
jgi:hypothetical protein